MKEIRRAAAEPSRVGALAPAAVALTSFLAFSGCLRGEFLTWDDATNFLGNAHYRGLGWTQLRWMFSNSTMGHYMPITWLTFGLDFTLWGMNPAGYHLTNLLLHGANAAVFFFVARRLLASAAPPAAGRARELDSAAAFAALFFALHPLRAESVAWITERRDVLSGFFYLLAVLWYLKAGDAAGKPKTARWLAASAGAFALSLLSKIGGIALPFILFVIDVYPSRRLSADPRRWFSAEARRVWLEKIPYLLLAVPAGWMGIRAQALHADLRPLAAWGFADRILVALNGASFYVEKTFFPWNLSPYYPLPDQVHLRTAPFLWNAALAVAIGAAAVVARRRLPSILAVWTAYLLALLPVSGLLQSGAQLAADRYTYLPCLGFALLAAAALRRLETAGAGRGRSVGLASLAVLGVLTWEQAAVWRDTETLWRHALSIDPAVALAQNNLGSALYKKGKLDEALRHYELAVQERPDYAEAQDNLGMALAAQGKLDEAIGHYRLALQARPDSSLARDALSRLTAEIRYNLGLTLAGQGKLEEAVVEFEQALQARPDSASTENNLGLALARLGRLDEAVRHYAAALASSSTEESPVIRNNLAAALAQQGKSDAAIEQLRQALTIQPDFESARANLELLLRRKAR